MHFAVKYLAYVFLWILVIQEPVTNHQEALDTTPSPVEEVSDLRTWTSKDGKSKIDAEFASFSSGTITLQKDDGSVLKVKANDLSVADHYYIVEHTGWGRVWESSDGKKVVADFLKSEGDSVILQMIDGRIAETSISRFSKSDQKYISDRTGHTIRAEIALGKHIRADVVGVSDGDTLTLLVDKEQIKVRLDGIDAPETGQAFGKASKKFLSSKVFNERVTLIPKETDKYGRVIGVISLNGHNINDEMLKNGFAWHYKQYSSDERLARHEEKAKSEKLGLWSEPNPIPPWAWRKWGSAERQNWAIANVVTEAQENAVLETALPKVAKTTGSTGADSSTSYSGSTDSTITRKAASTNTHWLNTNTGKRHNRGCRWYGDTTKGRPCSSNDGVACKVCGG